MLNVWHAQRLATAALLFMLFALPFAAATPIPSYSQATVTGAHFDTARKGSGAIWTGSAAYVFGGQNDAFGGTTEIVRFDPATEATTVVGHLPINEILPNVVWTGSTAYLFGAHDGSTDSYYNKVLRFDPGSSTLVFLPNALPDMFGPSSAAVWTGTYAYIFAGSNCHEFIADPPCVFGKPPEYHINRFDPVTETATRMSATFPTFSGMTAVWSGTYVYLTGLGDNHIYQYDPASDTLTMLPAMTLAHGWAAAVWDGTYMLLFGGVDNAGSVIDAIVRFDPTTGSVATLPGVLPAPRSTMQAIITNECTAYVFGGAAQTGVYDSILRFGGGCPAAHFDAYGVPDCHGETFSFSDGSTPAAGIVSQSWSFGDGGTGSGLNVEHFYLPGTYTVVLTVVDADGTTMTASQSIAASALWPCPPTIDLMPRHATQIGETVTACPLGHDGLDGTLSYSADALPLGAIFDSTGPCVSWQPSETQVGAHPCIRLTVTESPSGLSASTCLFIDVFPHGVQDSDFDGIADMADNCASTQNHDQEDADRDGAGDACDLNPQDPQVADRIPAASGMHAFDLDLDGVADLSDNCPLTPNGDQSNLDRDTIGDACDDDLDGDGIANTAQVGSFLDNCPTAPNALQLDSNGDGIGDACQTRTATALGGAAAGPRDYVTEGNASDAVFSSLQFVGALLGTTLLVLGLTYRYGLQKNKH